MRRVLGAMLLALAVPAMAQLPDRAADRVLEGQLTAADGATYRNLDFTVPEGTGRLVIALAHDGDPKASLIELGLADAQGFRGASSRRSEVTLAPADATPGYLPGRIGAGAWQLRFSVGFLPAGKPLGWTVKLWFMKPGERLSARVPSRGPGWYRGDLHVHSGHSDGSCANPAGVTVPCPLYATIAGAAARALDFLMLTEHNTVSQLQVMRELQPFFDRTLLIAGQEVTTLHGHINVWGVEEPIDYRIAPGLRTFNEIADRVHALGGLLSINHPAAPTGVTCLGCGWSMPDVDYARVDAVEAINGGIIATVDGGDPEGKLSNLPFWLDRLAAGDALVAVGGSDSHDGTAAPGTPLALGYPVTVVHAEGLSEAAILAGIKAGRVFVDLSMDPASLLDLSVSDGRRTVAMGGVIAASRGLTAQVRIAAAKGARLELLDGATVLATRPVPPGEAVLTFPLALSRARHAIRAQVRGADGRILLISNAVRITG
ncbi:CehA/McbA family metallohydrolase [Sphingomonas sanxanigenens]|nr:CehA/McbA family metallohydrolase [Sphingomonas sanxanigenens]